MKYPPSEPNGFAFHEEEHLMTDELDHAIVMHRNAHFGGSFAVMLEYYLHEENIGVNPDFDIERIQGLAEIEKELKQDLSETLLTPDEVEQVAKARKAYADFKRIYETADEKAPARVIADLILSEEQEPLDEIEKVISLGAKGVASLLQIVKSEEAYSPLFPGYGYAPYLAILCLGKIKASESVKPLFEAIGRESVFEDEVVVAAFRDIGKPACDFLLKRVASRPITQDNFNAAYALSVFSDDVEVAKHSLTQLKDPKVKELPLLSRYLAANCEVLGTTPYKDDFIAISKEPTLSQELKQEMESIISLWK